VDYAHDDRGSLLNCSLASRLFLPSARFYLFERLHLQSSTWARFFDLIESPLSTITRIWFIGLDFEDNRMDFLSTLPWPPRPTGLELLSIMTRLQGLGLRSVLLRNMKIEQYINLDSEITGFDDLKQLTITRGHFPDPSHMFDIILKFKAVDHLCMRQSIFSCELKRTTWSLIPPIML
jgi:hypothetical protein